MIFEQLVAELHSEILHDKQLKSAHGCTAGLIEVLNLWPQTPVKICYHHLYPVVRELTV